MINMNLRTSKTFKLLVGFDIPYIYVKGELGIVFSRVCLLGRDTNRAENLVSGIKAYLTEKS